MRRASLAGAVLVLLLAATAGAGTVADPGVTAKTVVLGGTVPLSGEAAAFGSVGPGAKAYFDYVNAKGGVNGRKIDYRFYDDGYDPAQSVQLLMTSLAWESLSQDRSMNTLPRAGCSPSGPLP